MFSFTYTYLLKGEKTVRKIPYDPIEEGWKWKKKINCCIHFTKGDMLLRIKTDTQFVIVEKEGRSRPLLSLTNPIKDQAEFIEKMKLL